MPTKTKTSKTRTRTKKLPVGPKDLSKEQKKKVKGGQTIGSPIGHSIGSPTGTYTPRVTVSSPIIGAATQLLDSELSAMR